MWIVWGLVGRVANYSGNLLWKLVRQEVQSFLIRSLSEAVRISSPTTTEERGFGGSGPRTTGQTEYAQTMLAHQLVTVIQTVVTEAREQRLRAERCEAELSSLKQSDYADGGNDTP
jgi:hypothetical protein